MCTALTRRLVDLKVWSEDEQGLWDGTGRSAISSRSADRKQQPLSWAGMSNSRTPEFLVLQYLCAPRSVWDSVNSDCLVKLHLLHSCDRYRNLFRWYLACFLLEKVREVDCLVRLMEKQKPEFHSRSRLSEQQFRVDKWSVCLLAA